MKHTHIVRLLSATLAATAFVGVYAQTNDDIPHRIIQGLRFDWPTAVVCLKETDSRDYIRLLRPRLSTYARLSAVPEGSLLIATVPPERMPILLETIAALDQKESAIPKVAQQLPSTFQESLIQAEPKEPLTNSEFIQMQYVPTHLKIGRLVPYLQMYGDTPITLLFSEGAILIEGDASRVDAQMELAISIDVAGHDHCVETNGD